MNEDAPFPSIDAWVIVLGLVGFVAVISGSCLDRSYADQTALVAVFFGGTAGALLGLLLGYIFRTLPVSNVRRLQGLVVASVLLVISTLYIYLPA
jgi:hypothetical protein